MWRDRVGGQRLLLLLDDAASSDQVQPLLPGTGGALVLITSRRHLTALEDARVAGEVLALALRERQMTIGELLATSANHITGFPVAVAGRRVTVSRSARR